MYQFVKISTLHGNIVSVGFNDNNDVILPTNLYELIIWLKPTFEYINNYKRESFSLYDTIEIDSDDDMNCDNNNDYNVYRSIKKVYVRIYYSLGIFCVEFVMFNRGVKIWNQY